jgi:predicted flap endonuclease-1-like 5' DNA nuclease
VQHNASATSLEPEAETRAKLGQRGPWLHVRLDDGREGYAFAFYLSPTGPPPPDTSAEPPEEAKIAITASLSALQRRVARTWNHLGGSLQRLAQELAVDTGVTVAVWTVESAGVPFGPDGRMTIRFENQIFYDYWGQRNSGVFEQHFRFNAGQRWTGHQWRPSTGEGWRACHQGQNGEWQVLNFARTLDDTAARLSISMGGPQIMGFNYQSLGYASVQEMFDAFAASEGNQVHGFFNFCHSRGESIQMLKNADFVGFARIYNGSGQAETYGGMIRQARDAYHKLTSGPSAVPFAVPFAAPSGAALPPMVEQDDLRRILGIGPKTAARLAAEGIHSFVQLAALDAEHLRNLLPGVRRLRWLETWPAQARLAAWGDWGGLQKLQARIKSQ